MDRLNLLRMGCLSTSILATTLITGCRGLEGPTTERPTAPNGVPIKPQIATSAVPNVVPAYLLATPSSTHAVSASLAAPLVCEPVVGVGLPLTIAQLGSGCTRWLQFTVGGLPQVGATPFWSSYPRACFENGRADLRLQPADIAPFARSTGARETILSSLTGTPAKLQLTYRIFDARTREPIDVPITLKGTPSQIVAQLPRTAAKLATLLGVHNAVLPKAIETDADGLELMGGIPWTPAVDLDVPRRQQLITLAHTSGLATMLLLWSARLRGRVTQDLFSHSIPTANSNMLFVQAYEHHYDKLPFPQPQLKQLLQRYPTNLALNWVGSYVADQANDNNREVSLANRTTIIAPNNPQTWLLLSQAIANEAQARRRGRYNYQMSLATSNAVDQLYHYQVKYSTRAVTVDPKYGHGWYALQEAATFDGKTLEALNAYEKALSLDPDQAEVFNWAMEMFQTKWGGNRFELIHAANLMAKTFHYGVEATYAAGDLLNDGYPNAAKQLSAKIIAANTALLATNPNDMQALRTMGLMLRWQNNYMGSIRYLKRLTMLEPTSGRVYDLLGLSYLELGINQPAYDALHKAASLRPLSAPIFESLAEACVHLHHFHQALAAATTAAHLQPTMVFAVFYKGYSLEMLGQPSKALPLLLQTAQLYAAQNKNPVPFWIWGQTGNCRIDLLQFHRAADDLTRCLAAQPGTTQTLINRAYCYNQIGKYALSEADSRAVLQAQPNNINSLINLGDSFSYTGDKADARKEWQSALQVAPNGRLAPLARADLKRDHAPPIVSKPH